MPGVRQQDKVRGDVSAMVFYTLMKAWRLRLGLYGAFHEPGDLSIRSFPNIRSFEGESKVKMQKLCGRIN